MLKVCSSKITYVPWSSFYYLSRNKDGTPAWNKECKIVRTDLISTILLQGHVWSNSIKFIMNVWIPENFINIYNVINQTYNNDHDVDSIYSIWKDNSTQFNWEHAQYWKGIIKISCQCTLFSYWSEVTDLTIGQYIYENNSLTGNRSNKTTPFKIATCFYILSYYQENSIIYGQVNLQQTQPFNRYHVRIMQRYLNL